MICATKYPVRVADQQNEIKLFNTKTFSTILLDSDSFSIYQLLSNGIGGNKEEIAEKLSRGNGIEINSIKALLDFLLQEGFVIEKEDE